MANAHTPCLPLNFSFRLSLQREPTCTVCCRVSTLHCGSKRITLHRAAFIYVDRVLCLLLSISMQQAWCRHNVQPFLRFSSSTDQLSLLQVHQMHAPSDSLLQAAIHATEATSSCWSVLWVCCSSIDRTLPFELRALEAALAHTCRSLEQESIQVERATLPALKSLMQKVCWLWSQGMQRLQA